MPPSTAILPEVIQVLLECEASGKWSASSLELLSDARPLAESLQGAVGGWLFTSPSHPKLDRESVAACGCGRLRHCQHERFSRWSSEAIADVLARQLPRANRLLLLPGSARGEEVAALVAERLAATWIPSVLSMAATRDGMLEIVAVLAGGKLARPFRVASDGLVVATMRPGVAEARPRPAAPIEVEEISENLDDVPALTAAIDYVAADPRTIDLSFAERIVAAGRGAHGPDGVDLIARLAESLHASLGGSRVAVDLGWVPPIRQVGQTGRMVSPALYVACGISGASHHLVGMRGSRHIVSLNPDPKAPIHELAHLKLHGDLRVVIPAILEALARRRQQNGRGAR